MHARRFVPLAVAALVATAGLPAHAAGAGYPTGDVFVSVADSPYVKERAPAGHPVAKYDPRDTVNRDLAFDSRGYLLVDTYRTIVQFDTDGNYAGVFADFDDDGLPGYPAAISVDAAGHVFVGAGSQDVSTDEATVVREYDPTGTLIDHFTLQTDKHEVPYIDLAADQCSLRYTEYGTSFDESSVLSYNVCRHRQQRPVTTSIPGGAVGIRQLPDGSGSMLVSNGRDVLELDATGQLVRTYHPGRVYDNTFSRISFAPDGLSFWTIADENGRVIRVRLSDGKTLKRFLVRSRANGSGDNSLFGLAVAGEPTAARPNPATTPR